LGQVFFASADHFMESFDFREVVDRVTIDLHLAHFWDITSVAALDKVVIKFRREGTSVNIIGMNEATRTVVDKFGVYDKPEDVESLMAGH
jgi:SulP family sulfate permease